MKKEEVLKQLAHELRWIASIFNMSEERKTDQGYGWSQALIWAFPDYFDDICGMYQMWNMAIHSAYKTTMANWEKKYSKYLNA